MRRSFNPGDVKNHPVRRQVDNIGPGLLHSECLLDQKDVERRLAGRAQARPASNTPKRAKNVHHDFSDVFSIESPGSLGRTPCFFLPRRFIRRQGRVSVTGT